MCPDCEQPHSIESVQHVLLHCPAHERRRAALRAAIASLPAAHASPAALIDDEGVIAFLRDDFMGGAHEARTAADSFLHAVITFIIICVEQLGAWLTIDFTLQHICLACMECLCMNALSA